jgi:sporulation protein YlmC with PRC-barrel domain
MREAHTVDPEAAELWVGLEVFDTHGERVGRLSEIYLGGSGKADLAVVKTGLFGLRSSFVPLAGASLEGDAVIVPYDRWHIREAPALPKGEHEIGPEEEQAVYRHYGLEPPADSRAGA